MTEALRAERFALSDPAPSPMVLTLWRSGDPLAEIELTPYSAVSLAAELLANARVRMGNYPRRWPHPSQQIAAAFEAAEMANIDGGPGER